MLCVYTTIRCLYRMHLVFWSGTHNAHVDSTSAHMRTKLVFEMEMDGKTKNILAQPQIGLHTTTRISYVVHIQNIFST